MLIQHRCTEWHCDQCCSAPDPILICLAVNNIGLQFVSKEGCAVGPLIARSPASMHFYSEASPIELSEVDSSEQ